MGHCPSCLGSRPQNHLIHVPRLLLHATTSSISRLGGGAVRVRMGVSVSHLLGTVGSSALLGFPAHLSPSAFYLPEILQCSDLQVALFLVFQGCFFFFFFSSYSGISEDLRVEK